MARGFFADAHGDRSSKRLMGFASGAALIGFLALDQIAGWPANMTGLGYLAMLCGGCFGLAQLEWFSKKE